MSSEKRKKLLKNIIHGLGNVSTLGALSLAKPIKEIVKIGKEINSSRKEKKEVVGKAINEADKIADKWEKQPLQVSSTKIPIIAAYSKDPGTMTKEELQKIHLRRNLRKQVVKTRINQYKNNK